MCGPITACGLANRRAFLCRRPEQSARKAAGQWSFTQASPANPNPSRSRTTHHVKQHRFANPPPHAGSCTVAFHGAVFRYLGSKPSRPGPANGSFPHAFARRRSWGSCAAKRSIPLGLRTSPKLLLARLVPTYLPWA